MTEEETPIQRKKPGPKAGVVKLRLKHNPKTAREDYYKKYRDLELCLVYGIDEFTVELIEYMWKHPEKKIIVTDPNEDKLSNLNRIYSGRSFSMYRWEIHPVSKFVEEPLGQVMVVSKLHIDTVKKLPNPYGVKFIVLEDI